ERHQAGYPVVVRIFLRPQQLRLSHPSGHLPMTDPPVFAIHDKKHVAPGSLDYDTRASWPLSADRSRVGDDLVSFEDAAFQSDTECRSPGLSIAAVRLDRFRHDFARLVSFPIGQGRPAEK